MEESPASAPGTAWHTLEAAEVAHALGVRIDVGHAPLEATRRLRAEGPNRLPEPRRRSLLRRLIAPFSDVMVLVLLAAAVVAGIVGEPADALAIATILILNAGLGLVQEFRAERALAALRALAAPIARVRRAGEHAQVPAEELVRGDVVLLEAGAVVPADLRLTSVQHLRTDESPLTGESLPVDKIVERVREARAPLGERRNLAFKGTTVTYGRGEGLVVATGPATELGRVARLLEEASDTRTPLQRRLERFSSRLALLVLALCAVLFALGLLRGEPPLLMFLTALSLAVAAMPEALPAVVTIALALGARRMAARRALVRRLPAVEALGSVTTIACDKTGTLTRNRMEVAHLCEPPFAPDIGEPPASTDLLRAMVLNSDAHVGADGKLEGDPTETALLARALASDGSAALRAHHPRLAELPFSSERGRMSTLHACAGGALLVTKGSPERVLEACTHEARGAQRVPLGREAALGAARELAAGGLRVLAFAQRTDLPGNSRELDEADENGLTLLGLVGLLDRPRPEARKAVDECRSAGIRVLMLTGDHPATAAAVAREIGLVPDGPPLTGAELERIADDELPAALARTAVIARLAPEQKIRLVRALQASGEFVAMTGDGVNDAPALRQAEIGVAMGRTGTEVAREAADLVLLDDDFSTIVDAVREGRRVYDDLRKFVRYVLTGNSGELWVLCLAPFVGLPLPLLPIQILWINLVTDGLPGLALATEPPERGAMRRPPRPPGESVFAGGILTHTLWAGLLMGAVCLVTYAAALHAGSPHARSMLFTVLALSQLGHVLAVRSERESLASLGLLSNRFLAATVAGTAALQLSVLYVPAFQRILGTTPLPAVELFLCLGLSTVVFLAVELEKGLRRRRSRRPPTA